MNGHVSDSHALVTVPFRVPGGPNIGIEFVIDAGFAGFLTLPVAAVSALKLPLLRSVLTNMADDRNILVFVHAATVVDTIDTSFATPGEAARQVVMYYGLLGEAGRFGRSTGEEHGDA